MITKTKLKEDLLRRYADNKMKIVGATCYCPICHKEFEKKTVQQAFCEIKCKDAYHNFMRYETIYPEYQCFREVINAKASNNRGKLLRVNGKQYPYGSKELEEALMNQMKEECNEFLI